MLVLDKTELLNRIYKIISRFILILFFYLHVGLPTCLYHSHLPVNILDEFLICPIYVLVSHISSALI
jgi:hypothetical protein